MKLRLQAGSMYKDILVLYDKGRENAYVIQVIDEEKQKQIYCNDADLFYDGNQSGRLEFNGESIVVPVWKIDIRNRISESMRIADFVISRPANSIYA